MATKQQRIENVHIFSVERAQSSVNGNPAFWLNTDHGRFRTQTDASLGYGIENYTNKRFTDTYAIGDDAPPVTLIATPANRVWAIEKDGKVLH